jgi:DNA repair protein RadC
MVNSSKNDGHRQRLRERLRTAGIKALSDYEILELLLTFVIPRRDTKAIAKELLDRFKTVSGVLHAGAAALAEVDGIGQNASFFLSVIAEVGAYCLAEKIEGRSAISHRQDVDNYLQLQYGRRGDEYIAALYLDNANRVLGTEVVAEGTVNQCVLYPRAVVERALKFKASSLILAHNHPGGTPQPSEADWQITRRLAEIGKLLDIPLLDHVIICQDRVVSLREMPRWGS